jgi:molybdopterin-binding protein
MGLMTVRVAAERMGIGYSTLKQWIHQGKVRTTKTAGGHHRLSEAEVDRVLAPQTSPAHARRRASPTGLIVALSGRNKLHGFVEEVRTDGLLGQIRLRIGDQSLTAVITSDAISELKLRRGDDAVAIIKSTEVMIAREAPGTALTPARRKRRRRSSS